MLNMTVKCRELQFSCEKYAIEERLSINIIIILFSGERNQHDQGRVDGLGGQARRAVQKDGGQHQWSVSNNNNNNINNNNNEEL